MCVAGASVIGAITSRPLNSIDIRRPPLPLLSSRVGDTVELGVGVDGIIPTAPVRIICSMVRS